MAQEVNNLYQQALALGVCSRFTGKESTDELMKLFLTPQGIEFCLENNFPDLATWRTLSDVARKYGIYIDAGDIELTNEPMVVLIGKTNAKLYYNDQAKIGHEVIMTYNSRAHITASNSAVVFVTKQSGKLKKTVKDNAILL